MEIKVKNIDLLTAIQLIRPTLDNKAGFESANVYFRAVKKEDESVLFLYASNFFTQAITKIPVNVIEEGEVLIPPQKLIDSLRTADKELMIHIKTPDDRRISVKGKGFSFHVGCHAAIKTTSEKVKNQFPLKGNILGTVNLRALMTFHKRSQFCVKEQAGTATQLHAFRVELDNTHSGVTATDTSIGVRITHPELASEEPNKFLITKDEYGLLAKVFADQKDATLTILATEGKDGIFFSTESTIFGVKYMTGGFPDVASLLEKKAPYELHLPTKDFLVACQRAKVFTNERSTVKITALPTEIQLEAYADKGRDHSDYAESIELLPGSKTEGFPTAGLPLYVDIDYILNILGSSTSTEVRLGLFGEEKTPILFSEPASDETGNTAVEYIMMPRSAW